MSTKITTIEIVLTDSEAWNLALFLKRVGWQTALQHTDGSDDRDQAQQFIDAIGAAERALNRAGYAPR